MTKIGKVATLGVEAHYYQSSQNARLQRISVLITVSRQIDLEEQDTRTWALRKCTLISHILVNALGPATRLMNDQKSHTRIATTFSIGATNDRVFSYCHIERFSLRPPEFRTPSLAGGGVHLAAATRPEREPLD